MITIKQHIGFTASVLLVKTSDFGYYVETKKGPIYTETEYFDLTKDQREQLHWIREHKGQEDVKYEIATAIEKKATDYFNKQVLKAQ